jgi:hypothetical protein
MKNATQKLIEHIDQLVLWFKEFHGTPIPSREKERLKILLQKMSSSEVLSEYHINDLKSTSPFSNRPEERLGSRRTGSSLVIKLRDDISETGKYNVVRKASPGSRSCDQEQKSKSVRCVYCKISILRKNIDKHQRKCKIAMAKQKKGKNKGKGSGLFGDAFDKGHDKGLDGSIGYHIFRENGRFGSHSSFDNMGDESSP